MDAAETKKALACLASQMATRSGILAKPENERGARELDELAGARLARDMHSLAWQSAAV